MLKANAVARVDNLEFLADVVPKTTTYTKLVAEKGQFFKPGPQAASQQRDEDGDHVNGETAPANKGFPRQARDIMDLTNNTDDERTNGHSKDELPENGDDVIMADAGHDHAQRDSTESAMDPIQEQLAMEMAGHQNGA
jgi:DNA polymerase epsilon subunit 4